MRGGKVLGAGLVLVALLGLAGTVGAETLAGAMPSPSRGTALYLAGIVVLAALPLMGRWLGSLAFFGAAVLVARGLMRIVSEFDGGRVLESLVPGLVIGVQLALALVATRMAAKAVKEVAKRIL